jgi:hypothetical protein
MSMFIFLLFQCCNVLFCMSFVIVHFYALCSGLIVATNTCSCARVEDVHYLLIVKKKCHI